MAISFTAEEMRIKKSISDSLVDKWEQELKLNDIGSRAREYAESLMK